MSHPGSHHRRLSIISRQIPSQSSGDLETNCCSGLKENVPHASATGNPSSYSRVHGKVSTEPVQWMEVKSVAGKPMEEVLYKKSKGEGIAMVRFPLGCLDYDDI